MPTTPKGRHRQPRLSGAADPTANVTGLGLLVAGDLYMNTASGRLFVVTATNGTSTITFQLVGAQV